MIFETTGDVLDWSEKQPRTLTKEFINKIGWKDVRNYALDENSFPFCFTCATSKL